MSKKKYHCGCANGALSVRIQYLLPSKSISEYHSTCTEMKDSFCVIQYHVSTNGFSQSRSRFDILVSSLSETSLLHSPCIARKCVKGTYPLGSDR